MSKLSKSPERGRYKERLVQNLENNNSSEMIKFYEKWNNTRAEREQDPNWQKNNLEYDLRACEWICQKVRKNDLYAQNLYAAMCNMDWQKLDVMPILKEEKWSCSWRYAGGIIADMRGAGDYIDWYCSGIGSEEGCVAEGVVTTEIAQDLKELGWVPILN